MIPIVPRTFYVDAEYLGAPNLIAVGVLETEAGLVLVDPGPAAALPALERKLSEGGAALSDVRALLLTHIHLDHAGATGVIVQAHPHVQVYVHRLGARHLARPERLLKSARRLYGEAMDELWGAFLPTPEDNIQTLYGGETLQLGGRALEVAYTPGHAAHHVSFFDQSTGTAFIGDVGGLRVVGCDYVLPVTPPPDVDVARWHQSLDAVRAWAPERLFVTHFGPSEQAAWHLNTMQQQLDAVSAHVRRSLHEEADDAARAEAFCRAVVADLRHELPLQALVPYEQFGQPRMSWYGLARYWRKKDQTGEPPS